jgi:hypothetical protein
MTSVPVMSARATPCSRARSTSASTIWNISARDRVT